jgi:hypothetical protein
MTQESAAPREHYVEPDSVSRCLAMNALQLPSAGSA